MNVKAILFLFTSCIQCIVCEVSSCEPAEKNSQHVITFRVSSEYKSTISIRSKQGLLGQCQRLGICNTFNQSRYNISQTNQSQYVIIKLTMFNVSEEQILHDGRTWFAIQKHGSYIDTPCRFPLYVKLQNTTCENTLLTDGLKVICSAQVFHQEYKCSFLFLLNGSILQLMGNISYINAMQLGNMNTLESSCTLFVQSDNLKPGLYNVNVTMFPIVTGTDRDIQLGSIMTSTLSLESPSVSIAHCPQVEQENAQVSCSCLAKNSHPVNVSVNWYDMNDQMQNRNQSHIMTFEVDKKQPDFYCQATNTWLWRSEKMFYNLSVLYPGSVKTFTVNGESRTPFVINQSSSLHLYCETEGNPWPAVRLLNGQMLLIKNMTKAEITYSMSCQSSNVFQCIAEQENGQSIKTINIYKTCPIQLKETPTNSTLQVDATLNTTVFIILDVYGYPMPTRYSLIKNETLLITFDDVIAGNAVGLGYVISYQDTVSPFGRVNLSFNVLDHNISANYRFILDNGIIPTLNYSFSIQKGILTSVISDDFTSSLQPSVVNLFVGVGAAAVSVIVIIVVICCYCRRKVASYQTESQVQASSGLYEEIPYEAIELSFESHSNLLTNNDNQIRIYTGDMAGRSPYDIIDESSVEENNTVNTRANQYDALDRKVNVDYDKYNRLENVVKWDTEYITVLDDFTAEDKEYITVIDELTLLESIYITAKEEIIDEFNDYITVLDYAEFDSDVDDFCS